jgi:WD40 repeat protein
LIRELQSDGGVTTSVCFSPDGSHVAASFAAPEPGFRMWHAESGKFLWPGEHNGAVRSVSFSADGQTVLSAGNDGFARFWNAHDGQRIGPDLAHRGEVFIAKFSPDGRMAVTGGYDATVRLWEAPTGRPLGEPMRHEGIVTSAVFSRDGRRLLTGSADGTARLWDVATCLPLAPPLEHESPVMSVAMNPAGSAALAGRFWHLPAPLPDDPTLVDLWVRLATERSFTAGENVEWLGPSAVAALAGEFEARTGKPWAQWGD